MERDEVSPGAVVSRETAEKNVLLFTEGFYDDLTEDNVCRRLKEKVTAFSYDEKSLTIEFQVRGWMINSWGTLHGGLTAMCADMTSGALARILYHTHAPTVSMQISYLRPGKEGDTLAVTAKAVCLGRTNAHFRTQIFSKESGKLLAEIAAIHYVGGEKCAEGQK